jgi:DNA polymerase III subunit delta
MVAIAHHDADRYVLRPSSAHYLFLIFGPDQGRRSERSQTLMRSLLGVERDTQQPIDLSGDEIAADPYILADEAHAGDMFSAARRVIRVGVGGKSILHGLDLLVRAPPADCIILLEAGDLRRDASLRKWFDQQSIAASIECRADDTKDIQKLIDTELKLANLTIDPNTRESLGAMLGEDRMASRSALTKLILYAHGQTTITNKHLNEILHDESVLSIDAVISALFSGRPTQVTELFQKALQNGIDINVIIAAALRYASALHRGRIEIESGAAFDDSLQVILRQFNGFNRKPEIASHLRDVDRNKMQMIISALSEITKTTRQTNLLTQQRVGRLFFAAAGSIQRR